MSEKHQPKYPRPRFPTISEQTKNFVQSMKEAASNPGFTEQDTYKRRRGICDACPYLKNNRCTKCGCLLMAKLRIKAARCPIGKW